MRHFFRRFLHAGRYAGIQKPPTKMRLLRALGASVMRWISYVYLALVCFCIIYFFAFYGLGLTENLRSVPMLFYYIGMWSLWVMPFPILCFCVKKIRDKVYSFYGRTVALIGIGVLIFFELWGLLNFVLAVSSI